MVANRSRNAEGDRQIEAGIVTDRVYLTIMLHPWRGFARTPFGKVGQFLVMGFATLFAGIS